MNILDPGSGWEFRRSLHPSESPQDETFGSWHPSLFDCVSELIPQRLPLSEWPTTWTLFAHPEPQQLEIRSPDPEPDPSPWNFQNIPDTLLSGGYPLLSQTIAVETDGSIDLTRHFGAAVPGRKAWLLAHLKLTQRTSFRVHAGGDWWMNFYINGVLHLSTQETGNRGPLGESSHDFELTLPPGTHLLCVSVQSGSGGWAFASEATIESKKGPDPGISDHELILQARRVIQIPQSLLKESVCFHFESKQFFNLLLNGKALPPPVEFLPGVLYEKLNGLPVSLLSSGTNILLREWRGESAWRVARSAGSAVSYFRQTKDSEKPCLDDQLELPLPHEAGLRIGPFFCLQDSTTTLLSCQTTLPCILDLQWGDGHLSSGNGMTHHFRLQDIAPGSQTFYHLTISGKKVLSSTYTHFSPQHPVIHLLGDPSPGPDKWAQIADLCAAREPGLVIMLGDLVSNGNRESSWHKSFFTPAQKLLSRQSSLLVFGNHDRQSPLLSRLFPMPVKSDIWTCDLDRTRWIGLRGQETQPEASTLLALEYILNDSDGYDHLFFCSHYPPYSSSNHGVLGEDGLPLETPCRFARLGLLPLLQKYHVSAWFTGHNHVYERSCLPSGLTLITTGGGGGYLYGRQGPDQQNPYSQVFHSRHHFLEMLTSNQSRGTYTLVARAENGSELDRLEMSPR